MTAQVSVCYTIPSMMSQFAAAREKTPGLKLGGLICNVGSEIGKHMQWCGQTVARLEKDGWAVRGFGDGCRAQHADVRTEAQAITRLLAIGIDPKTVYVSSTWDDWTEAENNVIQQVPVEEDELALQPA